MSTLNSLHKLNRSSRQHLEIQTRLSLTDDVLRLIWREHRMSRAEISRQLGLSRSTVTEIVKDLLHQKFVTEVGIGESSGGRKPIVLEFNDDSRVILGVDIGQTHVSVALTNLRGMLIFWKERTHNVREDADGTYDVIYDLCQQCLDHVKYSPDMLLSIGVSVPSPVDPNYPEYLSETIIPDWHGRSGIEKLKAKYKVPVSVDNDANLGALAEHWWGEGRDSNDLIYIKISSGIGAGLILNGKLYKGSKGIAGEISHIPINPNGRKCGCGLNGCLVTLVSAWALKARAETLSVLYPESVLIGSDLTLENIEDAAVGRDPLALQIISETSEHLSVAILGLVNMLNPDMIVLGGRFTKLEYLLLDPIRKKLDSSMLVSTLKPTQLKMSRLGAKGVAIGAATLAIEQAFSDPKILRHHAKVTI